jgi:hypothetical protein
MPCRRKIAVQIAGIRIQRGVLNLETIGICERLEVCMRDGRFSTVTG